MLRLRKAEVFFLQIRTYAQKETMAGHHRDQEPMSGHHKIPVHNLADENNPKLKDAHEPPIAELSHMVHKHRTVETPDKNKITSKVKTFLGKLGLVKEGKGNEPQKRSYSTKREEAEKAEVSGEVDKGPIKAKMAGLHLPPEESSQHARAKFDRNLFEAEAITYIKKQQALHRPLSPHLSIYAPQWTWVPSITHRFTGMTLTTALYGLGIGYMFADHPFPYYVNVLQSLHIPGALLFTAKVGLGFAVSFHTLNGIRHLIWDTGRGFHLTTVYRTAQTITLLSVVCGVGLAML